MGTMALNIKNREVDRLVDDVVAMTGESKTEAIRKALAERRSRLTYRVAADDRQARLRRFLESEVWPAVPEDQLGRRLTREEEDAILGPDPADPSPGADS
jgi:antitoxin VapB